MARMGKPAIFAAVLLMLTLSTPPAQARNYNCTFTAKQFCDASGCKSLSPAVRVKLDDQALTYSRCDRRGCDTHPAKISHSGIFTIAEIPGAGTFLKFGSKGDVVEVASQMTAVYVSHGDCR